MKNARHERLESYISTLINNASSSRTGDGNMKSGQEIEVILAIENVVTFFIHHPSWEELRTTEMAIKDNEQEHWQWHNVNDKITKEQCEVKRWVLDDKPSKGLYKAYILNG